MFQINDLCVDMPDTLNIDDYFDLKIDASTSSSSHHGRSVSELSGLSDGSLPPAKRQIGNGVILLAQRLINGDPSPSDKDGMHKHGNDEVCYHTAPQGISSVVEPNLIEVHNSPSISLPPNGCYLFKRVPIKPFPILWSSPFQIIS